jgi:hypothetical protein
VNGLGKISAARRIGMARGAEDPVLEATASNTTGSKMNRKLLSKLSPHSISFPHPEQGVNEEERLSLTAAS